MTVPTKQQLRLLDTAAERIKNQLKRHTTCHYDHKAVQLLYMTPAEIEETETFLYKYMVDPSASPVPNVTSMVTLASPLADTPFSMNVAFTLWPSKDARAKTIWPKGTLRLRPDADEAVIKGVEETLAEYVQLRHDFHMFSVVLTFIAGLRTFEEMRYLFPPILRVFRNAGLDDIAYKLEDARKPPKMSPLSSQMRKCIRHAIQWITVQELLGRLDNEPERIPSSMATFYLDGNITANVKDADGNKVEVFVPS